MWKITSEDGPVVNTARGMSVTGRRVPMVSFDFCGFRLFPRNFLDSGEFLVCNDDWFPHAARNKVSFLWGSRTGERSKLCWSKLWPKVLLIFVDTLLVLKKSKNQTTVRKQILQNKNKKNKGKICKAEAEVL